MKLKNILLGITLVSLLMTSCSGFLDENPYGELTDVTFFQTEQHAEYAANACYRKLTELNGFWASGTNIFGNHCSDDIYQNAAVNSSWVRGDFSPGDNYMVNGCYKNAYTGIARCNSGILKVGAMTEEQISAEAKKRYVAEMRFIRAFWYYRLVRLYGDVPMITEPVDISNEAATYPSRTALNDIYSKVIIPDLEFAAANLPAQYDNSADISRATKGAAYAYLTAVYMHLKDWDKAIVEGKKVEGLGVYGLLANPNEINVEYNEDNEEIIFKVCFDINQSTYKAKYYGTDAGGVCRGGAWEIGNRPHANLRDAFPLIDGNSITNDPNTLYDASNFWENRDPRFDVAFYTPLDVIVNISGETVTFDKEWVLNTESGVDFQKNSLWYGPNNDQSGLDNVLMRYAEVLLYLAEAHIMKNDFANGAKYINMVRKRARDYALANADKYNKNGLLEAQILPDVTITSVKDGMEKLRLERRIEFAGENVRGWDIRRWGIEKETWAAVQGITYSEKLKLFPIPQSEMDMNENLVQNSGY